MSMGPYAAFGIIDVFEEERDYSRDYEPEKYNCIAIPDIWLNDWWPMLEAVPSYFHCFRRPSTALARYGVTLIPPESLDLFYETIKTKTPSLFERKFSKKAAKVADLLALVKRAKDEGKYVIHFGV